MQGPQIGSIHDFYPYHFEFVVGIPIYDIYRYLDIPISAVWPFDKYRYIEIFGIGKKYRKKIKHASFHRQKTINKP